MPDLHMRSGVQMMSSCSCPTYSAAEREILSELRAIRALLLERRRNHA